MNIDVVVLAAGKGTRMRSQLAKVLHPLAGKSLIRHVLDTARAIKPRDIAVVIGHQGDQVKAELGDGLKWVEQQEQRGTGHAVQLGLSALQQDSVVLVLYGDVPLVTEATLSSAIEAANKGAVALVTAHFADPAQLGRIVRNAAGEITAIVEFKDASPEQRQITEINSGILAAPAARLAPWLAALKPNNAQGELYLTDVIAMAVADGVRVTGIDAASAAEVTGVNDRRPACRIRTYLPEPAGRCLDATGCNSGRPKSIRRARRSYCR